MTMTMTIATPMPIAKTIGMTKAMATAMLMALTMALAMTSDLRSLPSDAEAFIFFTPYFFQQN